MNKDMLVRKLGTENVPSLSQVTGEVAGEVTGEVTDQDNRQVPDKYPTSHPARILGLEGCRESLFKIRPSKSLGSPKSGNPEREGRHAI